MAESIDQHTLIARLKDLALEFGRTPTKTEYEVHVRAAHYNILKHFGTWTAMLQAAGLETYDDRRGKKRPNLTEAFVTDLPAHIARQAPQKPVAREPWPRASFISDVHWPFASPRVLARFYDRLEAFQPKIVALNGDAWDMFSHSRFPRTHNLFTPRQEQEMSRAGNEAFWVEVKKRVPLARCIQTLGNHDVRPLKKVLDVMPEAEDWIAEKMRELFTFEGVETIYDPREEVMIAPDVAVFHGYRTKLGDHRDFTLLNTINGHTHRGGAAFRQIRGQVLWELNSGIAGDPCAKGLTYTPQKISDWTPGFGELDELGPRFISA